MKTMFPFTTHQRNTIIPAQADWLLPIKQQQKQMLVRMWRKRNYGCGECKLVWLLLQQCGSSAKNLKIELPYDPAAPRRTEGSGASSPRERRHTRDSCGTIYNRKIRNQPTSLPTWMDRENTVHDHAVGHLASKRNSRISDGNGGHVSEPECSLLHVKV